MKPGYRTTEFWITLILTCVAAAGSMLPEGTPEAKIVASILAGAAALGYTISRGIVKAAKK